VKNVAYLVGKLKTLKDDGLQNNAPKDSLNNKRTLLKDSNRQTKHDLKNEKPKTEKRSKDHRQPDRFRF